MKASFASAGAEGHRRTDRRRAELTPDDDLVADAGDAGGGGAPPRAVVRGRGGRGSPSCGRASVASGDGKVTELRLLAGRPYLPQLDAPTQSPCCRSLATHQRVGYESLPIGRRPVSLTRLAGSAGPATREMPSSTGRDRQARAGRTEGHSLKTRVTGVDPTRPPPSMPDLSHRRGPQSHGDRSSRSRWAPHAPGQPRTRK